MQKFIVALALVGIVDAISYMVVAPSIVFYVMELGGTKEQYGLVLSVFSLSSFLTKPWLGTWSDSHGFRTPYLLTQALAAVGGLVYFLAGSSLFGGVRGVFLGRTLGGMGAANAALGYGYVARVLPHDQQTKVNSLLSMTRILGMATGPLLNLVLSQLGTPTASSSNSNLKSSWLLLEVNALNAAGLVLMVTNLLSMASIYFFLDEPPREHEEKEMEGKSRKDTTINNDAKKGETSPHHWVEVIRAILCPDILVYVLSIFTFNASFQIIETTFAPAASHALGWGPVQTSTVLGFVSIVIFVNMLLVFHLSSRKVADGTLLSFGLCLGGVGYTLMWYWWKWPGPLVEGTYAYAHSYYYVFVIPIVLAVSAFPYMAAPTRSLFTVAVDAKPALDHHHGTLQALLSMGASVAGFTAPGLVARYGLRSPKQVESSTDGRELTPWVLVGPLLSFLTLTGHWLLVCSTATATTNPMTTVDEITALVDKETMADEGHGHGYDVPKSCQMEGDRHHKVFMRRFSQEHVSHRHLSCTMMGVSQTHIHAEDVKPT